MSQAIPSATKVQINEVVPPGEELSVHFDSSDFPSLDRHLFRRNVHATAHGRR